MNVISFSGGRTSAYLCHLAIEKFGRENCRFIYCDTGAEHPKTYEFIRKVNDHFKLDLICLRVVINPVLGKANSYRVVPIADLTNDLQPFKDMMAKYGTPYNRGAFCTQFMKSFPFQQYCDDNYTDFEAWLGIRIDEPKRLGDMEMRQADFFPAEKKPQKFRYLAEISDFEKQDVLDWWSRMPFDLEINSNIVGNCVFCVKRSPSMLAMAHRIEPVLANEFITAITSDSVRITDRKLASDLMYRDDVSLRQIIKTYEIYSDDEIAQSIRSMKKDTGSCSESCEAFNSDNLDLFPD